MPNGGHLNITARADRVAAGQMPGLMPGDYVFIGITDTGCGMDEATLRRAAEPFFTTKDRGRGTGLGLSMVDGLVGQSGGAMRIGSRPGFGTTVELWLPASPAGEADREHPAAPSIAGETRTLRVLVVDDDPIVRASTVAMIEDLGHRALEAASAADALEVLRAAPQVDAVITDYAMPGVTGTALAAKLGQIRPGLPVIIATGYADMVPQASTLPRLDKPYRQKELAALLETLLERHVPAKVVSQGGDRYGAAAGGPGR
jgi:CheY-like chemotaxis protein